MSTVQVVHFTDPGCPWAYSASPALAALRWRFGDGLSWRLVTIGLTYRAGEYERRGYTAVRAAVGQLEFARRWRMPFGAAPKARMAATHRACQAIQAVRIAAPGRELEALRALQFGWFTGPDVMDEDDALRRALGTVTGLDADAVVAALDDEATQAAYRADHAEARTAAGGPTEAQGKAAQTDGAVRFTAPSLRLTLGDRTLEAGGFQPVAAYDVLLANLDPTLPRRPAPEGPLPALEDFGPGLTTQEVAAVMTDGNAEIDRQAALAALLELAADGQVTRIPLGDDALWRVASREA